MREENAGGSRDYSFGWLAAAAAVVTACVVFFNNVVWKPEIEFSFSNKKIEKKSTKILIGANYPDSTKKMAAYLPLSLRNNGYRTAKNVVLTIHYPTEWDLMVADSIANTQLIYGDFGSKNVTVTHESVGRLENVSYRLPAINPDETISLKQAINLTDTRIDERQAGPFTPHSSVVNENGFVKVRVVIGAEDLEKQTHNLRIMVLPTEEIREFAAFVVSTVLGGSDPLKRTFPGKKVSTALDSTSNPLFMTFISSDSVFLQNRRPRRSHLAKDVHYHFVDQQHFQRVVEAKKKIEDIREGIFE